MKSLHIFQAVTFIFKSLGVKGVPYLAQVIPSLLYVIRTADANFRDYLFQQLATLIGIVKQHIRNYLDDIIEVLKVRNLVLFLSRKMVKFMSLKVDISV